MKSSAIALLVLFLARGLTCAAPPRSVVITDDCVAIDRTTVAFKDPKAGFQLSITRTLAALGKPSHFSRSWNTATYIWDDYGIELGVGELGRNRQPAFLTFRLRLPKFPRSPMINVRETAKKQYAASIRLNGIPITAETQPDVLLHNGFKKEHDGLVRPLKKHSILLEFPDEHSVGRLWVKLPASDGSEWRAID